MREIDRISQSVSANRSSSAVEEIRLPLPKRYVVQGARGGGMGVVVFCYDREEERSVALKTFRPELFSVRGARVRFLEEVTQWMYLGEHPHIVSVVRVEQAGNPPRPYLVLERIGEDEDASLTGLMQRRRFLPLSFRRALQIALDVARAMAYATERIPGLVHRDLKPGNILIDNDGRARITDFGIARSFESVDAEKWRAVIQAKDTKDFRPQGTLIYSAPELWKPETLADPRADIYALGLNLYELLTSSRAVPGASIEEVRDAHCSGALAPFPKELPDSIVSFIKTCTALDNAERYPDWAAVVRALVECFEESTGDTPPAAPAEINVDQVRSPVRDAYSYLSIGDAYQNLSYPELATNYFLAALDLGKKSDDAEIQMLAVHAMTLSLESQQKNIEAMNAANSGLQLARAINDPKHIVDMLSLTGNLHARAGNHQRAMSMLEEALAMARDQGDRQAELVALGNFANVCSEAGLVTKAIETYLLLLQSLENEDDPENEATCRANLGAAYVANGEPEKGVEHLRHALDTAKRYADTMGINHALKHLCMAYIALNKSDTLRDYAQQYSELSQELGNEEEHRWALGLL